MQRIGIFTIFAQQFNVTERTTIQITGTMETKHFTQAVVGVDLCVRPPDRESL